MNRNYLIERIEEDKSNKECFDCKSKDIHYISFNNAIFLCKKCGNFHSKNLKSSSYIIIKNYDMLNIDQLNYLSKGGNSSLQKYMLYDYPKLGYLKVNDIYKTNAMVYYRNNVN